MSATQLLRIAGLLALSSSVALAQRGVSGVGGGQGIGSIGRRRPGNIEREPALVVPKAVNVINVLIEHRKDVALDDSQFVRVLSVKRTLDSTNSPLMRKIDSLQRLYRGGPIFSEPSAERRDSLNTARAIALETIASVRDNIAAAREKAFALLSPTQHAKAQEIEAQAERAVEEENKRDAARARAGGRGAGGLGRPPS
jgi:hypothetical protein